MVKVYVIFINDIDYELEQPGMYVRLTFIKGLTILCYLDCLITLNVQKSAYN